jgi:hypothetical protein
MPTSIQNILDACAQMDNNHLSQIERECILSFIDLADRLSQDRWSLKTKKSKTLEEVKKFHVKKKNNSCGDDKKAHSVIINIIIECSNILLNSKYFNKIL